MISDYVIVMEGLQSAEELRKLNPKIVSAARMAVNKAADLGRTRSAKMMREQVNFPASYLQGASSRLNVTSRASDSRLEAVITGRSRPTSLARFASGSQPRKGVRVQVKPGRTHMMKNAFLMKLRVGDSGALGNKGLAVRVRRGTVPAGAYKPVKIADGLFLLYGPSVDQVFKTVREDVSPDVESFLAREFTRLLDLRR